MWQMAKSDLRDEAPMIPDYDTVLEALTSKETQERTPQGRTSIDVSETIRRLQSDRSPKAQTQLNQYLQALKTKGI